MGELLIIGLFGVWFLLSVFVYPPKLNKIIRKLDWFSLIPEWRFFAPNPGQHDYHLLYRDKFQDGSLTQWTEIMLTTQRRWWNMVWNPGKRGNKAFLDTVIEFAQSAISGSDRALELSIPYLTLLNYVSSVPRSTLPEFTQFLLMYSFGGSFEDDPDLFYLSRFHSL